MGRDKPDNAEKDEPDGMATDGHEDKRAAAVVRLDQIAHKFATYEDFLDSQVTELDMYYLEDRSIARTIKELGFHGNSEKITREQFNEKKAELTVNKKTEEFKSGAKYLYTDRDVFLLELARREDANLSGRLVTVVFIRDRNAKGQEISSYIDFAQRLHEDNFASIFAGRERLASKITDLSHFNWDTNVTHSNNSPNFDIIFYGPRGLQLKCKKDRRILHLDPNRQITDTNIEDTTRTLIRSRNYAQVVLFDHFIRFWANEDDTLQSEEKLPTGPDTELDAGIDLYDNVTAAIYEDDLLEIARNALGGDLHQPHDGEWSPADIMVSDPANIRIGDPDHDSDMPPSSSLESSVLGTMKNLYEAHKNDVSFGTLGNFTFIQMIEQLGRLLPEKARGKVNEETVKINAETASITVKIPEEDLPLLTVDVDNLMEEYEKTPVGSALATPTRDPAGPLIEDPMSHITAAPQRHLETGPPATVAVFDPVRHIDKIRQLYPQRNSGMNAGLHQPAAQPEAASLAAIGSDKLATGVRTGTDTGKRKSAPAVEKLSGAQDHADYFRQLETRMEQIFHGVVKPDSELPAYPKTVNLQQPAGNAANKH